MEMVPLPNIINEKKNMKLKKYGIIKNKNTAYNS